MNHANNYEQIREELILTNMRAQQMQKMVRKYKIAPQPQQVGIGTI